MPSLCAPERHRSRPRAGAEELPNRTTEPSEPGAGDNVAVAACCCAGRPDPTVRTDGSRLNARATARPQQIPYAQSRHSQPRRGRIDCGHCRGQQFGRCVADNFEQATDHEKKSAVRRLHTSRLEFPSNPHAAVSSCARPVAIRTGKANEPQQSEGNPAEPASSIAMPATSPALAHVH